MQISLSRMRMIIKFDLLSMTEKVSAMLRAKVVFCRFLVFVSLGCFSMQSWGETNPPVWPTDMKSPATNPCVECTCPEIMDDGKYTVEQILSPMRGYHYSELFMICPDLETAGIWNTTLHNHLASNSRDSLPEELYKNYSNEKAAEEYGAVSIWMEPPRVWTYDRMRVRRGSTARNFSGIDTAWGAYLPAAAIGKEVVTYKIVDVARNSTFWFDAGKPIWVLDAPDGNTYVNQSVTDAAGGYDGLDTMGERFKHLPKGWTYRKVMLGSTPLTINGLTEGGRENVWKVMQDEFHNAYSGCWKNSAGESSCNFDP